jgi:hypothetical protein
VILGAILVASWGGCRSKSGAETAAIAVSAKTVPGPDSHTSASTLCQARPRCDIYRRQSVGAAPLELLSLRIAHAPDATSDEARCDQREYWLVRPEKSVLLARDCERQWGADNPGPADTHVDGTRLSVKYVEFQSSDNCEIYEATLQLSPLAIEKQARWQGTVQGERCQPQKRDDQFPPAGDGSIAHPLLVLHK